VTSRTLLRNVVFGVVAVVVVAAIVIGSLEIAPQKASVIHFVVPFGYRGPIRVEVDDLHGTEMTIRKGVYEVVVPRDGRVRVRAFDPFCWFHEETASYQGGLPLPVAINYATMPTEPSSAGRPAPPDVMLWGLGTRQLGSIVFMEWFVGERAEKDAYVKTW
jgi:hypothetical protein